MHVLWEYEICFDIDTLGVPTTSLLVNIHSQIFIIDFLIPIL